MILDNNLSKIKDRSRKIKPIQMNTATDDEMALSEHIEELRQRSFQLLCIILLLTCAAFIEVKFLVKIVLLLLNLT